MIIKKLIFGLKAKSIYLILGFVLFCGFNLSYAATESLPKFTSSPVVTVTRNSATFKWSTDVSTTAIVWYWVNGYDPLCKEDKNPSTSHTITIPNLSPGKTYKYEVKAIKGNNVSTVSGTFTTQVAPAFTTTPSVQTTETSATIKWTTNMGTSAVVWYWVSGYAKECRQETNLQASRILTLTNLSPGTTYQYEVIAANGNDAANYSGTFTTRARLLPQFNVVPSIQTTENTATFNWTTNMSTSAVIWYWVSGYAKECRQETSLQTSRTITLTNLIPGTTYQYEVIASNGNDAAKHSGTFTTKARLLPKFTVVPSIQTTENTATFNWTTDMSTSAVIWYWVDGYAKEYKEETSLQKSRTMTLTNLSAGTTYRYEVIAANGYDAVHYEGTFTTKARLLPKFTVVPSIQTTENTATFNWTTNMSTSAVIWYWVDGYAKNCKEETSLKTTRTMTLTNLIPGTTYRYEVIAANGYDAEHYEGTFKTQSHISPEFIIQPKVSSATQDSVTLSWKTNMATTAIIYFWVEGYDMDYIKFEDFQESRNVTIPNLVPGDTYQYEVIATKGYESAKFKGFFKTKMPQSLLLLSKPAVSADKDGVTIRWSTNVATSAILKYWRSIDQDKRTLYQTTIEYPYQRNNWEIRLSNLQPGTKYTFELLLRHSELGELFAYAEFFMGVPVSGIVLDKSSLELTPEATATISATVKPDNATNQKVTWLSSNPTIATVDNGKVTAVSPGTTDIVATTEDGGFKASCKVKVLSGKEKFLVIVSNELIRSVNGSKLLQSLDEYQNDLIKEGWAPKLITVNNFQDGSAEYVCGTPEELKNVIRTFYNKGYTGFVMIGSHPSLQIAWYRNADSANDPEDKHYADPCDIYFADMNGNWTTQRINNANFVCPPTDFVNIDPEMFFGRIYINGAVIRQADGSYDTIDTPDKEAREVIRYLNKVHQYRMGTGPAFSDQENNSYFIYGFVDEKAALNQFLDSQFTSITVNYDQSMSNEEDLFDVLENEGFKAAYINAHGYIDNHSYTDMFMKYGLLHGYFPKVTSEKLRTLNIKSKVVILTPCSSSRYCSYRSSTNGIQEDCIGKSILYNSDYVLNIYADLAPTNLYYPGYHPEMFDDATSLSTGKSAQNFLIKFDCNNYVMQASFYGDPTIRLKKSKTKRSSIPVLLNSYNNLEVQAGKTLSLPLTIRDNDSSSVYVEVTGLPEGTGLNRFVKIENGIGQTTLQYLAPDSSSYIGKWYDVTIRLFDNESNSFTERHRIYISPINNGMLMNKAAGWDIKGQGYTINDTETDLTFDSKTAEFTLKDGYVHLSQDIVLEPNREYRIIFYGMSTLENEVNISIGGETYTLDSGYVDKVGKEFWGLERYIDFKTGYNATYPLEITAGSISHKVSGKFKITGIKVVPLYWNDFDIETDITEYAFIYGITRWEFEESGELCVNAGESRTRVIFPKRKIRNFSCEFDIMVSNNKTTSDAGLLFRSTNLGDGAESFRGYYVGFDAYNKLVKLCKFNYGSRQLAYYNMNIEADKRYHVKVMAFEGKIVVYVDNMDKPIITYIDQEADVIDFQTGDIGLTSLGTHAHFDNILIDGVRDSYSANDGGPYTGPEPVKLIYGDANGDGKVDQEDVNLVKMFLVGAIHEFSSPYGMKAVDVDGDGNVDADDYAYMVQKVNLGILSKFPVENNQ